MEIADEGEIERIEQEGSKVKGIFQEASEKTLGYRRRKGREEWISQRILKLVDKRREYKSKRRESRPTDMAKQHNRMGQKRATGKIRRSS